MKIAFFSWESLHSIAVGGIAVHVSDLSRALAQKGHEIHVFTRMDNGQAHEEWIEGVCYHRCAYQHHHHFKDDVDNMCRAFLDRFLETERNTGRFDIVHSHDWLTANVIIWLKQKRDYKAILTMHSTEYGRCGNNFGGMHSQDVAHLEWSGIYHANRVIAVSKTLKEELKWLYSSPDDKLNVVYNGVNAYQFDGWIDALAVRKLYEIGPDDPIILFVGRMVYQKGPDILIESIPNILYHYPNAKFVFAGDGGMRSYCEDLSRQRNVYHATRFLGSVNGWRLKDLFKSADCVVVPSRNEPFGIVILEAWSAGKPVVASSQGGPSEIVWHDVNGYKVNPQPDSINWGLGTMLEKKEHAQWMGRNGRLTAETTFSWDHIADDTLKVYNN